jgi:hypothetical protein
VLDHLGRIGLSLLGELLELIDRLLEVDGLGGGA